LIQFVPKEGLGKSWEFYRAGILEIISHGGAGFLPEDVYHNIKVEKAFLYRVGDVGFFVLEKCVELTGDEYLNVWLMYFKPGHGLPYKKELLAFLDNAAKHLGVTRIRMGTTREGWVRLLDGEFKQVMVTLERQV
jgi:hypothetical protein